MKRLLTFALTLIAGFAMAQKNPIAIKHYDFISETDSSLYATTHLTYNNGKLMEEITIDEPMGDTSDITRYQYDAQGQLCYSVNLECDDTVSYTIVNNDYANHTSNMITYAQNESGTQLIKMLDIKTYGISDFNTSLTSFNLHPCDSFTMIIDMAYMGIEDIGMNIEKICGFPHKNQAGNIDSIPLTAYINTGFSTLPMNIAYIKCEYDNHNNCTFTDIELIIPQAMSIMSSTMEYDNNNLLLSNVITYMDEAAKTTYTYHNDGSIMVTATYDYDEEHSSWNLNGKDWYEYELNITETKVSTLTCYPNPTCNTLNIQSEENGNIYVYDINGKLIMNTSIAAGANTINLQSMAAGCYIIKFINNSHAQAIKVIKQ